MQQFKIQETREVEKIICNKCGKEILVSNGVPQGDSLHVEKRWGYFSEKDNDVHSFDLCEACYDEMVAGFVIAPEKVESK